jgi:hypothetical protein
MDGASSVSAASAINETLIMIKKLLVISSVCLLGRIIAPAQTIEVNFAKPDPASPDLYGRYLDFCGSGQEFTRADFQLCQEQLGRLKLVRIWGTNHIDYAVQLADEALMVDDKGINLNALLHGTVSENECVAAVEKHLGEIKAEHPFVTHIEPFNEMTGKGLDLPEGVSVAEACYKGFRVTMRAAGELNRKNSYTKPLLVGGPACMWPQYKSDYLKNFLSFYAKDPDTAKHLDFISVHFYPDDFKIAMSFRQNVEAILAEDHLPVVPLIMSEIGWKEKDARKNIGDPKDALRWATGPLAHTYQIAEQNVLPIHWVYPRKEIRHCMVAPVTEAPALLPKGNAIKLAQMLKNNHAWSSVALDEAGDGIYSVATFDKSGVAILLFNYDGKDESPKTITLKLLGYGNLASQDGQVTEYQLDQNHANWYADKKAWRLAPVDEGTKSLASLDGKTIRLEGNAVDLLLISFTTK